MNDIKKSQRIVMRIILLFAFLMSQSMTWKAVAWINQSAQWNEKNYLVFQIEGACIYTFLCICFTKDKLLVEDWCKKIPILSKFFNALLFIFSLLFEWIPKLLLSIPEIFNIQSSNVEIKLIKKEIDAEVERCKNSNTYERVFRGIGGLTIVIILIAGIAPKDTIQTISDVMNVILNIILFAIVCTNIDVFA